ncbi:MAG: LysM peptidoglycan-binding domain-containing protein, partial [Endomicrobiales bacterium]
NDWHLALAAYNRGEYGLIRDMRSSHSTSLEEVSRRKAVPLETERFVPKFMACVIIGSDPEKYGLRVEPEGPLRYDTVVVIRPVDLKVAAECARSTIGEMRALNPELKAWCTPYGYRRFELRLPPGTRKAFLKNMEAVKDPNPSAGHIKYTVGRGESLEHIAKKFATTAGAIRKDNRIRLYERVKENQTLVIRPGRKYFSLNGEKEKKGSLLF